MSQEKFRVLLLDTKFRNPNHYICLAVYNALRRHPHVEWVAKADPLDATSVASSQRCNLFIAFDGEEMNAPLCTKLAQICGRSVLWVTEDPYELDINLRHAPLFDVVFTNDSASTAAYGDRGCHLPLGGALEFHSLPVLDAAQPLRYSLFFAGTAWPNRSAFLRAILPKLPADWKCKFALPSNPFLPPHGIDMPPSMLSWRTSPTDFARFVNRSAITLMLPRVFSASNNKEYAETPPPRLYEAALAGGAQMIHESLTEVEQSFVPDRDVILFSSETDFLQKARQLVENRDYRNSIAESARRTALERHTYDCRVATILDRAADIRHATPMVAPETPRTLLFVVHNTLGTGHFGGVEVYLDRLRGALPARWKVLFYVADVGGLRRSARLLSARYEELRRFQFSQAYTPDLLVCDERERAFREVLLTEQVDLVHFHHFIGHVPSLAHVAKLSGIPSAFTAHDYFGVCHEFNLLSFKEQFCGAPDVSLSQCDSCLLQKHGIAPGSQAQRRNFWDDVLRRIDLLVFNTAGSQATYRGIYPAVRIHQNVRILPVPIPDGPPSMRKRGQPPLRIAFLGNVTRQKGGDIFKSIVPLLVSAPVEFHVFGRIDPEYERALQSCPTTTLKVHGAYAPTSLPDTLRDCDVSLHISIWPETYCLTLSEAWQLGLVPIVSDIGALGERVTHMVDGLKVPANNEGALMDTIRTLADMPDLLDTLRRNVTGTLYAQLSDHARALDSAYSDLLTRVPAASNRDPAPDAKPMPVREAGVVIQSASWYAGNGATASGTRSVQRLMANVRKLRHLYSAFGLRPTLRILANRLKISR
ncbi:glycosyltransferase [Burkholderia pseudomultivorans]|uniref:Glycosyl transferase family 1 n=1 Tax=Burkholderia pseudomultivorans TaxID=1207504 RepID=A0A132EGG9_9BURK|nr:glycosyltransferase [Burkholderia pseudomultivorans]KWF29276.1 glycosyl transferase family 1 [Burkholderia pseudomultivorans]